LPRQLYEYENRLRDIETDCPDRIRHFRANGGAAHGIKADKMYRLSRLTLGPIQDRSKSEIRGTDRRDVTSDIPVNPVTDVLLSVFHEKIQH
jgi:hypothetical protein